VLEIPSLRILRLQAQQDVETDINGSLGSRIRQSIAFALAGFGFLFLSSLQYLSRNFFLDTADDTFALLWASIYGITAKPATQASGFTKATGAMGSTFAGGELLVRDDGAEFFVDGAQGPISASSELDILVTAVEAGVDGNTLVGVTLTFGTGEAPAGVDDPTTVIASGIVDGFDVESVESIRARALTEIRAARRGGSEDDYEIWSTSVSGIASAWATDGWAGIGTVLVIVAQEWDPGAGISVSNTPIPTPTLIADVEAVLNVNKQAGLHGVFVQPPVTQDLDPYIFLDPDTAEIRTAVERSLGLALADVDPGGIAYYDDLVTAINRAEGEVHHNLYTTNDGGFTWGPFDTPVGDTNLAIPGAVVWTVPP